MGTLKKQTWDDFKAWSGSGGKAASHVSCYNSSIWPLMFTFLMCAVIPLFLVSCLMTSSVTAVFSTFSFSSIENQAALILSPNLWLITSLVNHFSNDSRTNLIPPQRGPKQCVYFIKRIACSVALPWLARADFSSYPNFKCLWCSFHCTRMLLSVFPM